MQQLRDKLAVAERTAKAEAQLKVRIKSIPLVCCLLVIILDFILLFIDLRKNIY